MIRFLSRIYPCVVTKCSKNWPMFRSCRLEGWSVFWRIWNGMVWSWVLGEPISYCWVNSPMISHYGGFCTVPVCPIVSQFFHAVKSLKWQFCFVRSRFWCFSYHNPTLNLPTFVGWFHILARDLRPFHQASPSPLLPGRQTRCRLAGLGTYHAGWKI